jgi:hypothetical protein
MKRVTPMMPSLPITAISADAPFSIFHDVKLGHDEGRGEISMMQFIPGLIKDFAERHRDLFQMGEKALVFGCWECVEKIVLSGTIKVSHKQFSCLLVNIDWLHH